MVAMHFTQICGYRAFDQNIILGGKGTSSKHSGVAPKSLPLGDSAPPRSKEATATLSGSSAARRPSPGISVNRSTEARAAPLDIIVPHTHAFSHNYLTGFHLKKVKFSGQMRWSSESNTLAIGEDTFLTGHAAKVTRDELVPQVSAEHVRQSQIASSEPSGSGSSKALLNIKQGDPAKYFAYVRFSETEAGVKKYGVFRYGGFVYFASEAHKNAGLPMEDMNVLEKNGVGTMRFKFGYEDFWQLEIGAHGDAGGEVFNFPPDVSKEMSQRFKQNIGEFSINIARTITWPWFGKVYTEKAPAVDEVKFNFDLTALRLGQLNDEAILGKCSIEAHHAENIPIFLARHYEGPLGGGGGMPGDAGNGWYPVTIPEMLQHGAKYYTWVMPDELGNGGFMYHMIQDTQTYFIYFEMLSLLCTELEETAYDRWMSNWISGSAYTTMQADYNNWKPKTKKHTLVFVIDMQNDFIGMSFQMPCARKRTELVSQLGQFIRKQFEEGATIVASLDYHPKGHCGVLGDCSNEAGPFMTYGDMPPDENYYRGPDETNGRYKKNGFPPHCEWFPNRDSRSVPSEGAHLFLPISTLLHEFASTDNSRVHTVFKGFNRTKESFSALPTYHPESGSPEDFTGGYAVSGGGWGIGDGPPSEYRPWPPDCYGFLAEDARNLAKPRNLAKRVPDWCFPMVDQLKAPEQKDNYMWRVDDVLRWIQKQHGDFDQVIVTGLVFDFCVKETAFNAKKHFPGKVIVPFELARPACEGGPLEAFIYPPAGLGTKAIIERTVNEYWARGINLVKIADIER